jgi:hypothetical protein
MNNQSDNKDGELRKEYDFSRGVCGKYAKRYKESVTIRVGKSTGEKPRSHEGHKGKDSTRNNFPIHNSAVQGAV